MDAESLNSVASSSGVRTVPGIYSVRAPSGGIPTEPLNLTGAQQLMLALGMRTPLSRSLFAASVATGAMWVIQPRFAFGPDGETLGLDDGGIPWWTVPIASVLLINLLV